MTTRFDRPGQAHPPAPPASTAPAPPPGPAPVVRTAAASRRANRKLLVLSILVVLLGGVVALGAARMLTKHTEVLVLARDVQVGAALTDDDLAVANVTTDPHLDPVPAADRAQVIGLVAQVKLFRGGLLTRSQLGKNDGFTTGQALVALALKPGQFPVRGLVPGQLVEVVSTPDATTDTSTKSTVPTTTIAAIVADVGQLDPSSQVTVIDVRVNADNQVALAQLNATGHLAVILQPGH
jgi:SAF domain